MKWSSLIRAFLVVLVVMVLLTSMTAIQADTEKEGIYTRVKGKSF